MPRPLETFLLFLRLGVTAFGGPAVHIAMMEDEFVQRRAWMTRERFLDLFGTASLIPGPTSTELALLIGLERAGWLGLLLAGFGFILPAFVSVMLIAAFFSASGETAILERLMRGIQPVILAVVAQALFNLGKTAFKTRFLMLCAVLVSVAGFFDVNILPLLLAAGFLNIVYAQSKSFASATAASVALFGGMIFGKRWLASRAVDASAVAPDAVAQSVPVLTIFLNFLKLGAVFYGSGYVMISFLREEFVNKHLITEQQLITAIAVGQFTPGPFFTAATFVGYQMHGWQGGVAATVGIFAPAFLYAALSGLFIPRLRRSPLSADFLDGVNAASCALMMVVTAQLSRNAITDWKTAVLGVVSAAILIRFKLNATWLIVAGAAIGWFWL